MYFTPRFFTDMCLCFGQGSGARHRAKAVANRGIRQDMGGEELELATARKGGDMGEDELAADHSRRQGKGGKMGWDELQVAAPDNMRRGKELDAGGTCCALGRVTGNCAPAATADIASDKYAATLTHSPDLDSLKKR
jgi:hypothetical protein